MRRNFVKRYRKLRKFCNFKPCGTYLSQIRVLRRHGVSCLLEMVEVPRKIKRMENYKKAYIAGGCFWGMEDLFRDREGILDTEVGYQGGENESPTYRNHPGHAESMEITYDPNKTNFREILDYFFRIHNPTTVNQQGNDRGSSYRSTIFIQNEEERKIAEEVIDIVNKSGRWDGKVVTTLESMAPFWAAEPEHQDYLVRNPNGYTCHFERFDTFL